MQAAAPAQLRRPCTALRTQLRMDLLAQLPILVRNKEIIDLQGKLTMGVNSISEEEFRDGLNHLLALSMTATTNEQNRLVHYYDNAYLRWHLSTPVSVGMGVPVASAYPVEPSTPPASPPRDLTRSAKPVRIVTWGAFCDVLGVVDQEHRRQIIACMKEATAMKCRGATGWGDNIPSIITGDLRNRLRAWVANLDRNYSYKFGSDGEGPGEGDKGIAELLLSLQE
ncbi:MAG: hypothetical protein CMD92_09555 [Gammaproteobacteria bacterium]|nr:hypothetical protein [Gammaproteobacteria bacterium]|tara:strand:- start:2031 stop:2705 length:675 start_codon:yes stop_codon:yes gene_type:complete